MPNSTDPPFPDLGFSAERRKGDRRAADERRRDSERVPERDRRSGETRRLQQRRDTVHGHLRNALQILLPMVGPDRLGGEDRETIASAMRRIWLALLELERGRI